MQNLFTINGKQVSHTDNFKVWEKYEVFIKYTNLITTFIDNEALYKAQNQFKAVYNRYEESCKEFYNEIENIYRNYYEEEENVNGLKWDIDFKNRLYNISKIKENFDVKIFALKSLGLRPEFEIDLLKVIE